MFYFILLLSIAFFLLRVFRGKRVSRRITSLIAVNFVLLALYVFVDALSGNGFDESVIYHLVYGLKDAGFLAFIPYVLAVLFAITVSIFLAVYSSKASINSSRDRDGNYFTVAIMLGLAFCLLSNPLVSDFRRQIPLLKVALSQGKQVEREVLQFRQSKVGRLIANHVSGESISRAGNMPKSTKKNVIWIYAESLERTYLNEAVFGDLLTGILAHAEVARRYTSTFQPWGTGWTIGGIVGSQCGLPLVTLGARNGNSLADVRDFMPGAYCVGDALKDIGYTLEFVGGASGEFAGKGNFLKSHGFETVWDRVSLSEGFDDGSNELNQWGYYDDFMFSVLKKRAVELHGKATPFFLNGLTLDTHSPHGFVSPLCRSIVKLADSNHIAAAIRCSDFLISDFISWFKSSDLYDDTLLVLSSDHLSMPNSLHQQLKSVDHERRLLFWVIGKGVPAGAINKDISTFDIGATVLGHVLSEQDVSIGLGRNVEYGQSLYSAKVSDDDLRTAIPGLQAFSWREAAGSGSLILNSAKKSFSLGSHSYPFPALVEVRDGQFSGISWVERERNERYIDLIKPEFSYVWIDNCGWSADDKFTGSSELCVHFMDKGVIADSRAIGGNDTVKISARDVSEIFRSVTGSQRSVYSTNYAVSVSGTGGAGGLFGEEFLRAKRGVNIFERTGGENKWSFIKNFDLCADSYRSTAEAYVVPESSYTAVVVADSAHCDNENELKVLGQAFGLKKLGSLKFRQSYIALLRSGRPPVEYPGSVGSGTVVALPEL